MRESSQSSIQGRAVGFDAPYFPAASNNFWNISVEAAVLSPGINQRKSIWFEAFSDTSRVKSPLSKLAL